MEANGEHHSDHGVDLYESDGVDEMAEVDVLEVVGIAEEMDEVVGTAEVMGEVVGTEEEILDREVASVLL
jgi:hypothetical protein